MHTIERKRNLDLPISNEDDQRHTITLFVGAWASLRSVPMLLSVSDCFVICTGRGGNTHAPDNLSNSQCDGAAKRF